MAGKRIFFDGEQIDEMRRLIPSLRKHGKPMSCNEVADMLGVEPETVGKWTKEGAPMWVKYALDGLRIGVLRHIGEMDMISDMPLSVEDKLYELDRKKKALLAFKNKKKAKMKKLESEAK